MPRPQLEVIDINRKLYWSVLLNPIVLIFYSYGIRILWLLCQYGGIRRRTPVILGIGVAGIIWIVSWTIIYFVCKKQEAAWKKPIDYSRPVLVNIILIIEITALVLCTGFYGYRIYRSSVSFNGKLSWYLEEKKNSRQVEITENNFYKTGIDGILSALEVELDIEEISEIYVSGNFKLSIDKNGTIEKIEALLYMPDSGGVMKGYLINYDDDSDCKMTVWLNGPEDVEYPVQMRLEPMQDMIRALQDSPVMRPGKRQYTICYGGYACRSYEPEWYLLTDGRVRPYPDNSYGMSVTGYMMTVSDEYGNDMTIVSEVDTLHTIEELEKEKQTEVTREQAEEAGKSLVVDNNNGTMTFYLDEENSMSLTIIDAAAGSRWYTFSTSAGITNDDPFAGNGGVAEGIYFMDTQKGFVLLSGASFDYSRMYYTEDGGVSFTEVLLPMEDARADVENNQYGFEFDNFDYIDVPYEENGMLYVGVGIDSVDMSYAAAVFRSEDQGKTWVYDHVETQ